MLPIPLGLALAALLAGPPRELPVRCPLTRDIAEVRGRADAVFAGRIVSQRDSVRTLPGMRNTTFEASETEHTFVVDASWKLPAGGSDTVRIWSDNGAEITAMKQGERYLVYASSTGFLPERLYAWGCGNTRPLSLAEAEIAALGTPLTGVLPPMQRESR